MPVRKDVVSAAISSEPGECRTDRGAEVGDRVLQPPTSGLWSSGTADTVTVPSWDASAPMPRPATEAER